jgi:hypothetical protein
MNARKKVGLDCFILSPPRFFSDTEYTITIYGRKRTVLQVKKREWPLSIQHNRQKKKICAMMIKKC